MGQTITLLNTNTIDLTKALSNTQGLFLCLTLNSTLSSTLSHTLTNTLNQTPRIINTPTMESPPWEFGPSVGIQCDIFATPTWEFVPSVGICLHPPWEFGLVLAEEKII